jgi:streptogramin lyase
MEDRCLLSGITEYMLPSGSGPLEIVSAADHNLWFTEYGNGSRRGRLVRRVPGTGAMTEFTLTPAYGFDQPDGLTATPDGKLWFTEYTPSFQFADIGRIDPLNPSVITDYDVATLSPISQVAADPYGFIWFTLPAANKIGRLNPNSNPTHPEVLYLPVAASPRGITTGPDGRIWFTEWDTTPGHSDLIGRITPLPGSGLLDFEHPVMPTTNGRPVRIRSGPDGNLYFSEVNGNKIGRVTVAGVVSEPYSTPGRNPRGITTGPDGNLWYAGANQVGRIVPGGSPPFAEFPCPRPACDPYEITPGPDGKLWFTESNGDAIGVLDLTRPITATATPVTASEGMPFTGGVAAFTDPDPRATATDFTAQIHWNSGPDSPGAIVTTSPGHFSVVASHTWDEESPPGSPYPVVVTITDLTDPAHSSARVTSSATVKDAPLFASGVDLSGQFLASEKAPVGAVTLAYFTDADPGGVAGDYKATIAWGDPQGSSSTGRIVALGGGLFAVATIPGSFTYQDEGRYTVTVTIQDAGGSVATALVSPASVADPPPVATPVLFSAVEGTPFNGRVATFIDPAGPEPLVDGDGPEYTATVYWGDGTNSPGTIEVDGTGGFVVTAAGQPHTYVEEGVYSFTVYLYHEGYLTSITIPTPVKVADPAVVATGGFTFSAVEGRYSGLQQVASFTDPGGPEPLGSYDASIDWGTGDVTGGLITTDGMGNYFVWGDYVYAEDQSYPITVTIHHEDALDVMVTSTASVADPVMTAFGTTITGVTGVALPMLSVAFVGDPGWIAGTTYSVTVQWGDGDVTNPPPITPSGSFFSVDDTKPNPYATAGRYPLTVTITELDGDAVMANSTAVICDTPCATSPGLARDLPLRRGESFAPEMAANLLASPSPVPVGGLAGVSALASGSGLPDRDGPDRVAVLENGDKGLSAVPRANSMVGIEMGQGPSLRSPRHRPDRPVWNDPTLLDRFWTAVDWGLPD